LELGICLETHLLRFSQSSTAVPGKIREDGRSIPLIWS
jgi:hypothetical protein